MHRQSPHHVTPLAGVLATAAGGALGALVRWDLEKAFPVSDGRFPWTVFTINVAGAALLAALPLLPVARRRRWVGVFLGTGVLGGFTTMSTASTDTFALLDSHHVALALAYCLGTAATALAAVSVVDRLTTADERSGAEDDGWDE